MVGDALSKVEDVSSISRCEEFFSLYIRTDHLVKHTKTITRKVP